jgi:hypothetical protein
VLRPPRTTTIRPILHPTRRRARAWNPNGLGTARGLAAKQVENLPEIHPAGLVELAGEHVDRGLVEQNEPLGKHPGLARHFAAISPRQRVKRLPGVREIPVATAANARAERKLKRDPGGIRNSARTFDQFPIIAWLRIVRVAPAPVGIIDLDQRHDLAQA